MLIGFGTFFLVLRKRAKRVATHFTVRTVSMFDGAFFPAGQDIVPKAARLGSSNPRRAR